MRPGWIALVAAYAFVLQALFGAVLSSQAVAAPDAFAICFDPDGGGDGAPQHGGKASHDCGLCTVASAAFAIVPDAVEVHRVAEIAAAVVLIAAEQISAHHSPTGLYQTGPPRVA